MSGLQGGLAFGLNYEFGHLTRKEKWPKMEYGGTFAQSNEETDRCAAPRGGTGCPEFPGRKEGRVGIPEALEKKVAE